MTEIINGCGMQVNIPQLLKLLGPTMYKGDVTSVACKELLQNSFDACKPTGTIELSTSHIENSITCKDNGIGMSPDIVQNVYLSIGGTWKDNLDIADRSGGLGLAKVQFFLSAIRLRVDTIKNGKHTVLDCTQEELLGGTASISIEDTDAPSGTTVTLWYPKEYTDVNGSTHKIEVPSYWNMPILERPLVGYPDVEVRFNNTRYCELPSNYTHTAEWEFGWGVVKAYYDPKSYNPVYSRYTPVHSAGLFQFEHMFRTNIFSLDYHAILDIRPKVKAGDAGYPFNNTREDFNVSVKDDLEVISKYLFSIQKVLRSESIRLMFANLTILEYTDVDGSGLKDNVELRQTNKKEFSDEFLRELNTAFNRCSNVFKEPDIVKRSESTLSESVAEAHSEDLRYKNTTNGLYKTGTALFSKVASVVMDTIGLMEDKSSKRFPTVAGIQIRKGVFGCLVTGDALNGLFINPLACPDYVISECWVQDMADTIIHELAHIKHSGHYESFIEEMKNIRRYLVRKGYYNDLLGKLRRIYKDEAQTILALSEEFNHSTNIA